MTSRVRQPDTDADRELRACLQRQPVRSFVMVSGAGSGKTTSLVKALAHLQETKGPELRRRGQSVACITYTEIAANEIWNDVGNSSLFQVSTIHHFLWTIISPFQPDIKEWVAARLDEKIEEAIQGQAKPRIRPATREKLGRDIERYRAQRQAIQQLTKFRYGTGSDYGNGVLGHDDIIKIGPALIESHLLLSTIVSARFPLVFVDESQDTMPAIVEALRRIGQAAGANFCLGFFGDPMQKIYTTGIGPIQLGNGWTEIRKPENFRCPRRVLGVINRIRAEDDRLEQIGGRTALVEGEVVPVEGMAKLFILPADNQRTERLGQVRRWLAAASGDPMWQRDDVEANVRLLVLVHRMAAIRLGFPNVYSALNDGTSQSFKDGLLNGTIWVLRPFMQFLLSLVLSVRAGADFDVISALRENCPRLSKEQLTSDNAARALDELLVATQRLAEMLEDQSVATIGEVMLLVRDTGLMTLDDRFAGHLERIEANGMQDVDVGEDEDADSVAVARFLACNARELWGYRVYIEGQSPFATHHGIKGAEFQRVLVVLDDEEGAYNLYSYGKYFGYTALSETDERNRAEGVDSVIERTRRLFYVCCSRAEHHLAVVLFAPDVDAARAAILAKGIFSPEDVHDAAALNAVA